MTLKLRLPANSQAYLQARRDLVADKFDVTKFTYGYLNQTFPTPWAFYKFNESATPWTQALDSVGGGGTLVHGASDDGPDWDAIEQAAKFSVDATHPDYAERYVEPSWFAIPSRRCAAISIWFKATGTTANFISKVSLDPLGLYVLLNLPATRRITAYCNASPNVGGDGLFTMNALHLLVFVVDVDNNFSRLYLDNVKIGENTDPGSFFPADWDASDTSAGYLSIGGPRGDNVCYIKQVGIWLGSTLSDADVARLWNNGAGWSPY